VLSYILIFFASLVIAFGATPVARRIAVLSGVVAVPGNQRYHQRTTPLLGGLAIYVASAVALILFSDRFYVPQLIGIFVGATFVSFLGVWDDRSTLPPVVKLGGQAIGASLLVATGIQAQLFTSVPLNLAVSLIWIVGVVNALNLVDNMDGLSSGVAAVASAFFLVLAVQSGQFLVASLAAALLGACLGFLYYNFNPASIFMGDSGSLFLGYILAAVGLKLKVEGTESLGWLIPLLILGVPLFDTALVSLSRIRRGVSPFQGGKDHVSHRLVRAGWTNREAVMALYLTCGALGVIAMLAVRSSVAERATFGAIVCFAGVMAFGKLEEIERSAGRDRKVDRPDNPVSTDLGP
jgi:UDP-GlcNAc:undecaprenyl-phosphate GlcNAc-1-phosphate transferase